MTALTFIAFGEVIVRLGTIIVRGRLLAVRNGQGGTRRPVPVARVRA